MSVYWRRFLSLVHSSAHFGEATCQRRWGRWGLARRINVRLVPHLENVHFWTVSEVFQKFRKSFKLLKNGFEAFLKFLEIRWEFTETNTHYCVWVHVLCRYTISSADGARSSSFKSSEGMRDMCMLPGEVWNLSLKNTLLTLYTCTRNQMISTLYFVTANRITE